MKRRYLFLKSILVLAFSLGFFSTAIYSEQSDMQKLEEGKPLVWTDLSGKARRATGKILINASGEDCWKVLSDLDTWSEWAPCIKHINTVSKSGNHSIVVYESKFLFITVHTTEEVTFDHENKIISGRQLSDEEVEQYNEMGTLAVKANCTRDVKETHRLEPYGDKTIWTYSMDTNLKFPAPKVIDSFMCKQVAPGFLKAAKARVESGTVTACKEAE